MSEPLDVLIIGGYGEFGGRLAILLLRDNHKVLVAGRSIEKAKAFCTIHGGIPVRLDINKDLKQFDELAPHVVVDASGPFQQYGANEQRYRVAKAALEANAHYIDLSDDGEFTRGIVCLNELAVQRNRFALSGVSSTPALSSAAVSHLSANVARIEKIETTILPGSKAPQGDSVMQAILNQVGNPVRFWRSGDWHNSPGWSESLHKTISTAVSRRASLITTADTELFPAHFNARSVLFRAGLSMPIMHLSLTTLAWLRSRSLLPNVVKFVKPLRFLANCITPFGNDSGGMLVEVVGPKFSAENNQNDTMECHQWALLAEPGQGPYVPAVASRALLRFVDSIPAGARPCINEQPLNLIEESTEDIGVQTSTRSEPFSFLMHSSVGEKWSALPMPIKKSHAVIDLLTLSGNASVERGNTALSKFICSLFRFPKATESIDVKVVKRRHGNKEIWERDFGGQTFKSTLSPGNGTESIIEQFGLLRFTLQLPVIDNAMHMNVVRGSCLGIPIPQWLLPISNTSEYEQDGKMHFSVQIIGPLKIGLLVHYRGWLE